ncbi:AAA family ATPase [Actinoplanes sp. CA-142083]|uniref:AAA family ATPase n=1 Tax=Actinoplanes sp. CA-142083 TaxID=3239903 RepID=UPI003D90120F
MPQYAGAGSVVPVIAVYGANASGKSNLLDAMRWMQTAVHDSFRVWEADSGVPRARFRLDADETRPSVYVVDLLIDDVQWVYGFSVTSEVVQEEWLHTYPHGRERVVFERRGKEIELGSTLPERRGRADLLRGLLRDNALLLSTASQANQAEVKPVYHWFRRRLVHPAKVREMLPLLMSTTHHSHREFLELLRVADLGIKAIAFEKTVAGRHWVRVLHGPDGVPLDLADESEGTLAWAELLIYTLDVLALGSVLVVDEIDASLHPRLTARLIELFRNPGTNAKGAQLVFTTHDATLLGTNLGGEVLQRDEIWFVEKQDGASRLFPLSDFHPRKGENRERRYLAGSYGAVPVVFEDSLVKSVLAARGDGADGPP